MSSQPTMMTSVTPALHSGTADSNTMRLRDRLAFEDKFYGHKKA